MARWTRGRASAPRKWMLVTAASVGLLGVLGSTPFSTAPMSPAPIPRADIDPVPCPARAWQDADPAFEARPGARAFHGRYDGGLYRIEVPANWNGDLVLYAHGFRGAGGENGGILRVGNAPIREHLLERGFAWAASSYRCNGYVPGQGLEDTMGLVDLFTGLNGGRAPGRVYLTGTSMGGHVTLLGMHEYPTSFAGGLAMCPAGPGLFDYFAAVGAAAEVITGVQFTADGTAAQTARMAEALGSPSAYTERGRQLASVQIAISGGARPFAMEGLESRFLANISGGALAGGTSPSTRAIDTQGFVYEVEPGLGITGRTLNERARRVRADPAVRGPNGPFEELRAFDGEIERPLLTMHGTGDLFVPIFLQRWLKDAVHAAGNEELLVQRVYRIPGHCGFSDREMIRAFDDLVAWVTRGERPAGDDVSASFRDAGRRFTDPLREGDPGTIGAAPMFALPVSRPAPSATAPAPANGEGSVAMTRAGRLRGELVPQKGVHVFRGVHYGRSTAGDGRFKSALAVAPWDGVRDATRFADVCPQVGTPGRASLHQDDVLPMSEDCLALNVWTPGLTGERPVLVWLHGRGYNQGAGSEGWYDGTNLASHGDVVVVTINHRLNVFGHLYLGEIGGQDFAASGLVGLLDAQLALEWVRENIRAFGGDPANVTIFGESGGGSKVATLMGIPSAKGLFHKAVIQSGPTRTGTPAAAATANARRVMAALGVSTAEELQRVPFMELLGATERTGLLGAMRPVVDGRFLPADMFVDRSAPSAVGVPLMIGSNRDEHIYFSRNETIPRDMSEAELRERIGRMYGGDADLVIAEYRRSRPGATPWELFIAIGSARMGYGSIQLAQVHQASAPVYLYMFEFEASRQSLATHAAEVRFVFRNASDRPNAMPGAAGVEDAMSDAWIAFARTGDPSHAGIPRWPRYDLRTRPTMVFDVTSRVVNDLRPLERAVHDRVGLRP